MHVRKNDRVIVIAGKEKGKIGRVIKVLPEESRVIVEGLNKVKRHTRPTQPNREGGIIEKEAPIHSSNVALVAKDGKPTRVGFKVLEGGQKIRISRRTGEEI